ncbi:MAG: efflux RND transporter periplasmic adaptor subunit [Candidatus Pacebacteria bacterium]|nr:efflux RND transporter periplasmic adaptor subunit [Candidatus Paceibacterota bacterium]
MNIKSVKEKIFNFIKNNKIKSVFLILFIIIVIYFILNKEAKNILVGKLETGNIDEIVTVSGQVESSEDSSLAFEKIGKINAVNVKVGDKVYVGQNLASIDSSNEYAATLSANANVSIAEANLNDALKGPSDFDIKVKEDALYSAKNNLDNANNSVNDTVRSVNSSLSDVVQNKLGNLFSNSSGYFKLNYNSCSQALSSKIETSRGNIENNLKELSNLSLNFSLTGDSDIDTKNVDNIASLVSVYTKNVSNLLNDLNTLFTDSCSLADGSLDSQRLIISTSIASISNTSNSINSIKSQILSYRNAYSAAKYSLEQVKSGSSEDRIKSLRASLDSAKAGLVLANANYKKDFIVAPFNGIVKEVSLNLGEISSSNSPAIKIMSDSNYQIKAKLTEIDIVKVKVGDKVKINLDTYGDGVVFEGVVSEVYPAAINEGGVSTYYIKISFVNKDERIRSGMNATAEIVTDRKENTNYISNKFVLIKKGEAFVKVVKDLDKLNNTSTDDNDSNIEVKNITIGIRGRNGEIEILSGLSKEDSLFPIGTEVLTEENNSPTKK